MTILGFAVRLLESLKQTFGLLISYFSSLSERFVARKTIRKLNDELAASRKKNADFEASLASGQAADAKAGRSITSVAASVPESSAT